MYKSVLMRDRTVTGTDVVDAGSNQNPMTESRRELYMCVHAVHRIIPRPLGVRAAGFHCGMPHSTARYLSCALITGWWVANVSSRCAGMH